MSISKTDATAKEKAATQSSERKTLDLALSAINKQYGDGTLMRMGDATKMTVSTVSTGSVAIDLALGVGGLPRGRIVEIFGPESSGKTTLCLSIIAEIQRQGGNAVFVDVEHALDPRYSKIVGVDLDNLLVSQPESGEDALNIAETLIRSGAIDVIVIDSVAALVSKQELEGQMGDSTMGVQARMMSQAMRRLTAAISRTNCVVIFTNQIREKIGVMFGNPETTTGGNALKFYASVRLDIRRMAQIKDGDEAIGNRVKVKVVKNKVAPPFRAAEFEIIFGEGISKIGEIIDMGVELEIINKSGSWFSYEGNKLGQGRDSVKTILHDNPEMANEIEAKIRAKIAAKVEAAAAH